MPRRHPHRHPPRDTIILPDGVTVADVLDRVAARPERRAKMPFCACQDAACAFCGEPLDVQQDHVLLTPLRHDPYYTVPGISGPHVVHAACWHAVLTHGVARLSERLLGATRPSTQAQEPKQDQEQDQEQKQDQ